MCLVAACTSFESAFSPTTECPTKGGAMVNVGVACIDATEVTFKAYSEFLASVDAGAQVPQPSFCGWNTSMTPAATGEPEFPVVGVNFCQARAFCAWAGKRLCGAIGGGPVPDAQFADPNVSQWTNACTSGGKHDYVYGDTYRPTACRGRDVGDFSDYTQPVRTARECRVSAGPFAGVYDLLGNADEWEDSCEANVDAMDLCHVRGGSTQTETSCKAGHKIKRNTADLFTGFRCCSP